LISCRFEPGWCVNIGFAGIVATNSSRRRPGAGNVMVICELTNRTDMETADFGMLSVFAGFVMVLWGIGMRMLYSELSHQAERIQLKEPAIAVSAEMKQELYDLITMALDDVVGQIQMPTAADHAMGALSTWIQHKIARSVPGNIIEGVTELAGHGQTKEWQEEVTN